MSNIQGKWIQGQPPRRPHGQKYLVEFTGGCIASAMYRLGRLGEPSQDEFVLRADCCGRYGAASRYLII